ncbi:MAG: hypothetical protein HYX26_01840 [Acidobacteriales bacterium]|nr:hypothetical protein [Terriglobales bacterium]
MPEHAYAEDCYTGTHQSEDVRSWKDIGSPVRDVWGRERDLASNIVAHLQLEWQENPYELGSLTERFREQAEKWDRETAHMSSPLQRMIHPSYQAIIGMSAGSQEQKRDVIRLMLLDLRQKRRDWFLALSYLTEANPIPKKDYGRVDRMIDAWLRWGAKRNLI